MDYLNISEEWSKLYYGNLDFDSFQERLYGFKLSPHGQSLSDLIRIYALFLWNGKVLQVPDNPDVDTVLSKSGFPVRQVFSIFISHQISNSTNVDLIDLFREKYNKALQKYLIEDLPQTNLSAPNSYGQKFNSYLNGMAKFLTDRASELYQNHDALITNQSRFGKIITDLDDFFNVLGNYAQVHILMLDRINHTLKVLRDTIVHDDFKILLDSPLTQENLITFIMNNQIKNEYSLSLAAEMLSIFRFTNQMPNVDLSSFPQSLLDLHNSTDDLKAIFRDCPLREKSKQNQNLAVRKTFNSYLDQARYFSYLLLCIMNTLSQSQPLTAENQDKFKKVYQFYNDLYKHLIKFFETGLFSNVNKIFFVEIGDKFKKVEGCKGFNDLRKWLNDFLDTEEAEFLFE